MTLAMLDDQPQTGQPLTLEYVDQAGYRTVFEGMVAAVEPDRFQASLSATDAWLEEGDEVRVRFCDRRGLCHFMARVYDATPGARQKVWLAASEPPRRHQRRRFQRLGLSLPATCTSLDSRGAPLEACRTTTLEIGGNGAGLVADRAWTVGDQVRFTIDLGARWGRVAGTARVKRSVLALTPRGGEHRVALQFVHLDSSGQARILSFLLASRAQGGT